MEYLICNVADENIFSKQCEAIEKNIKNLLKHKLLEDVDGSKIQLYTYDDKEVKVVNDFYTNEVRVESTEDIRIYFNNSNYA